MNHIHNPSGPPVDIIAELKKRKLGETVFVCGEVTLSASTDEIICTGCDSSECEDPEHLKQGCHPRGFRLKGAKP